MTGDSLSPVESKPRDPRSTETRAGDSPTTEPNSGRSGIGRFFDAMSKGWGCLPWVICGVLLMMLLSSWARTTEYFDTTGGITEKFVSGEEYASEKVAILSVEGVLMEGQGFIKHQIDQIRRDKDIKAVVLRVDSPGGTVTGSDYVLHHLNELRNDQKLPIVVSMGSIAASGGYYISMGVGDQEKSIYAEPTSTTGSIGVIIPHYDVSGLMAKFDVKDDSIVSHPRKQMLSMTRPLTEDTRPLAQEHVNEAFGRFKEIIKGGRPRFREHPEELDALATGEVFSAEKAKQLGLVDEIGFVEAAIDRAAELAGVNAKKVRVVKYERPVALLDLSSIGAAKAGIRGWSGANEETFVLKTIADASTPRAWYLYTTFPGVAPTKRAD